MIKKRKNIMSDPDVTAYLDIAFLLIIFFILTTSFSTPLGRLIEMPSASKPENEKTEDKVPSVNIFANRIEFGDSDTSSRELTTAQLRAELRQLGFASRPKSDRAVVVEVAEDVTYQWYYEIVMMIAESGGIVTMVKKE